jgi:hypothetical protein
VVDELCVCVRWIEMRQDEAINLHSTQRGSLAIFFTIFVVFIYFYFSDSNISFSTSHGIAWQGRPGQGRFQHVPAPRHTPPRGESDNDRASEGRGEAERVDIPQRNATHARILAAFSFLLGDGCTRG